VTQEPSYLPLSVVEEYAPLAKRLDVSVVARSRRGFLAAYRRAGGNFDDLPETWRRTRWAFVSRHMAQLRGRGEPLFLEPGVPSRRHLALIMWAYSPAPSKL